jgi:hypothetical protein
MILGIHLASHLIALASPTLLISRELDGFRAARLYSQLPFKLIGSGDRLSSDFLHHSILIIGALLIPLWYHRERNTVQHRASCRKETGLGMLDLQPVQPYATPVYTGIQLIPASRPRIPATMRPLSPGGIRQAWCGIVNRLCACCPIPKGLCAENGRSRAEATAALR